MPGSACCCVFGCRNSYLSTKDRKPKVSFYSFPKQAYLLERRNVWINFVKRMGNDGKPWRPVKSSYICSDHFISGSKSEDPRNPAYNPTIHPMSTKDVNAELKMNRYTRLMNRHKNSNAVNSGRAEEKNDEPVGNQTGQPRKNAGVRENSTFVETSETVAKNPLKIPTRCFVCFESQDVDAKNYNLGTVLLLPGRVMTYVSTSQKLTTDIIKSLECPPYSDSYTNIHCAKCRFLCDNVNQLSVQLDEIKLKLNASLESYIERIATGRENFASGSTIRVAKDIFAGSADDNQFSHPKSFDSIAGHPVNRKILPKPENFNSKEYKPEAAPLNKLPVKPAPTILKKKISAINKEKQPVIITKIQRKGEKFPDADFNKHKVYRYKCKKCPKVFWSDVGLKSHMVRHSKDSNSKSNIIENEPVAAEDASCISEILLKHKDTVKVNEPKNMFKCRKCSKGFPLRRILIRHNKKNPNCNLIRCKICNLKVVADMIQIHTEHYHPSGKSANLKPVSGEDLIEDISNCEDDKDQEMSDVKVSTNSTKAYVVKSLPKCTTCKNPLKRNLSTPKNLNSQTTGKVSYYCLHCKKTFMLVPTPKINENKS